MIKEIEVEIEVEEEVETEVEVEIGVEVEVEIEGVEEAVWEIEVNREEGLEHRLFNKKMANDIGRELIEIMVRKMLC